MTVTIVKNATCTFCGCVCDDIELHADGERIVETQGRLQSSATPGSRTTRPSASTPTP